MDEKESQDKTDYVPIWSISEGWRALFVLILILMNLGGTVVSIGIEIAQREALEDAFEDIISRTALIAVGSVSITFVLTELVRILKMLSTWVEKKLNENLEKSRRKKEEEMERALAKAVKEAVDEALKEAVEEAREKGRVEGRTEGYLAGREAERAVIEGKQPPPPPWEGNGKNH